MKFSILRKSSEIKYTKGERRLPLLLYRLLLYPTRMMSHDEIEVLTDQVIRLETLGHSPWMIYKHLLRQNVDAAVALEVVKDITGWLIPLAPTTGLSEATRAKMATAKHGRKIPPEVRAKISATLRAKGGSPRGPLTDEGRARMAAANEGRAFSAETRAKISATKTGKPRSPEVRAKIAAGNRGKTLSLETRAKISAAKRGHTHSLHGGAHPLSRAVITPDGRFDSITLAAQYYGLTRPGASRRAREQRNGWRFADDQSKSTHHVANSPSEP